MAEVQVVFFYGDQYRLEDALASRIEAISALHANVEKHSLFADEIDAPALAIELSSASLFAYSRHFVIRRTEELKQKAFHVITNLSIPSGTYLTFLATNIKSTSAILKAAKKVGKVVALPAFKAGQATKEASRIIESFHLRLSPRAKQVIIDHYSTNLLALREEARKMQAYASNEALDEEEVCALMFAAGEESIYPVLDAIMSGNMHEAMARLARLHEDPAGTFSALTRQLTRVLMVRTLLDSGLNAPQMASSLQMPDWMIRRFIGQAKRHTAQRLTAALDLAIQLDLQAKNGGIRFHDALLKLMLFIADPLPPAQGYARKSQLSPTGAC
jgi:DNA polymerase III delta subunit